MAQIDYFYSAHSAYAYLGHQKLLELCREHGIHLIHKPFLLSPVMEASGGVPFDKRSEEHNAYFFDLEIKRWSRVRNVAIMAERPTFHDNSYDLANRLLIAAGESGPDVDALAQAILTAHWVGDADLSREEQLASITESTGLSWSKLHSLAESEEIKMQHHANQDEAIMRSVFGSPTYFLDGAMFYGQDRLEMLELALKGDLRT